MKLLPPFLYCLEYNSTPEEIKIVEESGGKGD